MRMDAASKPRLRWYRLTPDRLVLGLLAVEAFLLLSQWRCWLPMNQHKGWTVLADVAAVGLTLLLLLVWLVASLLFRWRFQYSLRSLLLLVVAVAVPCSWLATEVQRARKQREAVATVVAMGGAVKYDMDPTKSDWIATPTPNCPTWLQKLLGDDFFAKAIDVTIHTDAELGNLKALSELEYLQFDGPQLVSPAITDTALANLQRFSHLRVIMLPGAKVTDAGLVHLKGLSKLRALRLVDTAVTDNGVKKLQQALPNCEIDRF